MEEMDPSPVQRGTSIEDQVTALDAEIAKVQARIDELTHEQYPFESGKEVGTEKAKEIIQDRELSQEPPDGKKINEDEIGVLRARLKQLGDARDILKQSKE